MLLLFYASIIIGTVRSYCRWLCADSMFHRTHF